MPTFIFPDKEIERYKRHGIAHARIPRDDEAFLSGCTFDLTRILEIAQPKYAWVEHTPKAPQIIFTSVKKNIPNSAIYLKPNKKLKTLEVIIYHTHPNEDYSDVKLNPIYTE